MWVWTYFMLQQAMKRITGSDSTALAPLLNAVHGSLGAPVAATPATLIGDVTPSESGYIGYARTTGLTWNTPFLTVDATMSSDAPVIHMSGGNDSVSGQVFGEFLLSSDSTKLLGVNMFPTPVVIQGTLTGGDVIPRTGVDIASNKGSSVVSG